MEVIDVSKKAKTCNENCKDFFIGLPDEILVQILSFLPIKDAIKTAHLRRFGNLWRQTRVLDFGNCVYRYFEDLDPGQDEHSLNFRKFIRHLLCRLESPTLDKFIFKFDFFFTLLDDRRRYDDNEDDAAWEKGVRDHIEKLIRYALSKQVKVMEFDLCDGNEIIHLNQCYDLPDVLSSDYLVHLKLSAVKIMGCRTTNLKALKTLLLDEVTLNNDVVERILIGCPLLEDLSLIYCYGLKKLVCKNPNLKKLMLSLANDESWVLKISCPHVLSLSINGWLQRAFLMHTSSMVDVSILKDQFSCTKKQHGVRRLLKKVRQCNTFRPCLWTILVFTVWNLRNVRCPSLECKNLILKLGMIKWHHPGLSLLLRNCQSLETLTMDIFPSSYEAKMLFEEPVQAKWIEAYELDMDNFWDSQEASFPSLKTITINGYVNEPNIMEMVAFLLRSATSLQELVICTQKLAKPTRAEEYHLGLWRDMKSLGFEFTSMQLLNLFKRFKSLPRASPEVVIYFS